MVGITVFHVNEDVVAVDVNGVEFVCGLSTSLVEVLVTGTDLDITLLVADEEETSMAGTIKLPSS